MNSKIIENGGEAVLSKYKTLSNLLPAIFPEHAWLPWRFVKVPLGYWKDERNHRLFFDHLAKHLQLNNWEDWYKVHLKEVKEYGGGGLLREYYKDSLPAALRKIYPEKEWQLWKFESLPKDFAKICFNELAKKLNIQRNEDWYSIKTVDLVNMSAGPLLAHFGGSLVTYYLNSFLFTKQIEHLPPRILNSHGNLKISN